MLDSEEIKMWVEKVKMFSWMIQNDRIRNDTIRVIDHVTINIDTWNMAIEKYYAAGGIAYCYRTAYS